MMDLQFRMATPADYPNLVTFWNLHSGWDEIEQSTWEARFIKTPSGPSAIALAISEQKIVGQLVLLPYRGKVGRDPIRMYRLFGAVVAPNTSIDNMGLTNLRLLQESIRYLTEQGVDLIYVLPDPKWKGFMSRYLDIQIERFPLYSRLLTIDEKLDKPSDIQIEKIDPADERINPLWQQLSDHYPVSPVKDGPYFNWKSVSLGYQLFLVKESHQPIGLFALSNRGNTPDISIAEWLTDNGREHQRLILQAAISESIKQKQTRDHLRKVGILANQNMIPLLEELGFWPDDYTYLLGLQPLQDQYRKELTNMANWQLSAGD